MSKSEIVFVYTLTESMAAGRLENGLPRSAQIHETIARHYQIPAVNVGQSLLGKIESGVGNWDDFTIDKVHPNDAGYRIYADATIQFLEQLRTNSPPSETALPAPLEPDLWQTARLMPAANLDAPDWEIATQAPPSMSAEWHPERYAARYVVAQKPGTKLIFRFRGAVIGLFFLITPDSGDIEFSIDGGQPQRLSMWDKHALQFTRPSYRILADGLAKGEHQLKLRILAKKDQNSTGHVVRLLAMMVDSDIE